MTTRNKNEVRILIVDDEQGMRDMLSFELGSQGYQVLTAVDGLDALSIVRQHPVDLVISDIKMPRMDGVSALEEIKRVNPGIEVIVATGFGTIETAVTAMKKGAYDFIQKPYNLEEIDALVEKALEKNELRTMIALYESSRAIFSAVNLDQLLPMVMDVILKGMTADEGSLLFAGPGGELSVAAHKGAREADAHRAHLKLGERVAGRAAKERKPLLLVGGLDRYPEFRGVESNPRIGSSIVIPLVHQEELLGVLTLNRLQGRENFTTADLRHASIFAGQIAQAVSNARLFQALESKVAELKDAYRSLEQAQSDLVAAERMAAVGRLVSGVAHEINNPLTSVLGYTELLLNSGIPPEMKGDLQTVFREAQRCRKIVQDLLIFARKQKPVFEPVDIGALIERTLEALSLELRAAAVRVEKNVQPCPPIKADPLQMQQVFMNILKNAVQILEKQTGDRRIEISAGMNSPSALKVVIADNGPGIAAEHLNKVFEPFFTTKDIGKGTGLGLSISHGIVQRHGGCILVESAPGKGASFIIELPAAQPEPAPAPAGKAAQVPSEPPPGRQVLVVEDEEAIRSFLKRVLGAKGLKVQTAENGQAALALLGRESFDLVLCDLLMPVMNGQELFEKVKEADPKLAERFIFITGCSADRMFDQFIQRNGLIRLTKPFVPEQLVDFVVEKLCSFR